jgi:hypothetical protein
MFSLFSLMLAFSFCLVILLLILRFLPIAWQIKAVMTLVTLGIVYAFYSGVVALLGMPVDDRPTCVMLVEGIDIREPAKGDEGGIFFWYVDVDAAQKTSKPVLPRAIRIPYSLDAAKKMAKAVDELKTGKPVFMQFDAKSDKAATEGDDTRYSPGTLDFVKPPGLNLPEKD